MAKAKLKSLNSLRFFMFLPIFAFHASGAFSFTIPYLAEDCVTWFFCLSGFLMAYQHGDRPMPHSFKDGVLFAFQRVKRIYLLYLLSFLLYIPITIYYQILPDPTAANIWRQVKYLVCDLLLVQSWSPNPDVFFSINGVAWFFSVIAWLYLATPIMLTLLRKAGRFWQQLLVLLALLALQYAYESIPALGSYQYAFPPFRLIHYAQGGIVGMMFLSLTKTECLADAKVRLKLAMTAAEIGSLVLWYYVCAVWSGSALSYSLYHWARIAADLLVIAVYAAGKGYLSQALCGKIWVKLGEYNRELYLLHASLIVYFGFIHQKVFHFPLDVKAVVLLAFIVLVSAIVHHLLGKWKDLNPRRPVMP